VATPDPVSATAHVVVDRGALDAGVLPDAEAHHLGRVRRLRAGEVVTLTDGAGAWRAFAWRDGGGLEPLGALVCEPPPDRITGVAFALTKGDKPEWVVQKLTELGVAGIVPFVARRSVVRHDEVKARRHHERLVAVARAAAGQSRRVWLPEVVPTLGFAEVSGFVDAWIAAADGESWAVAAAGARPPAWVLVGPEGGWDPAELAVGLPRVRLAAHVLRAETAAVAAGVLMAQGAAGSAGPARG
jgi:16S rRNA (uracil1498-N3)-methyltransferase